ncbi:hypothetical protein CDAR_424221 [Caerostris darwini]|uniref:Uncharacterized protein n=1 Tax=Caerostris darwini TaxID=1538125 RepID=A0AAV4T686_9ARAC|nr:hypothetical protein CDAR_424221 [Caerostris darwini]
MNYIVSVYKHTAPWVNGEFPLMIQRAQKSNLMGFAMLIIKARLSEKKTLKLAIPTKKKKSKKKERPSRVQGWSRTTYSNLPHPDRTFLFEIGPASGKVFVLREIKRNKGEKATTKNKLVFLLFQK